MKKTILLFFVFCLVLFSCKKEDKEATTNLTEIKADSVAGIPINTIHQISRYIPTTLEEDSVLDFIRENKEVIYHNLLQYEIDRLNQAL